MDVGSPAAASGLASASVVFGDCTSVGASGTTTLEAVLWLVHCLHLWMCGCVEQLKTLHVKLISLEFASFEVWFATLYPSDTPFNLRM